MVTTRLGINQTCSFIRMVKCFGFRQLFIKVHARSMCVISPSTSKCASWNLVRGHSTATRCRLRCTTIRISSICPIIGNRAHGTSSRCRLIWMFIKIQDNQPKLTSHSILSFDERLCSIRSIWFCRPFWFHSSVCLFSICLPRLGKRYLEIFTIRKYSINFIHSRSFTAGHFGH